MPHLRSLILNLCSGATRKIGILIEGSGAAGYVHQRFIFQIFSENKERKKTEVTLSLILRFNLRLGGYSICSASTSRTIYD